MKLPDGGIKQNNSQQKFGAWKRLLLVLIVFIVGFILSLVTLDVVLY